MPTSLGQSLKQTYEGGISPQMRRYGFFPGLFPTMLTLETFHSGQQEMVMPQGEMIRFDTVNLKEDDFEITKEDWKKSHMVERSAAWFIANVKKAGNHLGFVELDMLTLLEDEEAEAAFSLVHPIALSSPCPERLRHCATCRIAELEQTTFPEGTAHEALRLRVLQAYVTVKDFYRERWVQITKDYARGLATMDEGEKWVRRNLHEVDPETRNADASRLYGEAGAQATREGMKEIAESLKQSQGGDLTAAITMLAEGQRQQGEILAQLVANQKNAITTTVTEAPKPDKRTREYRESRREQSNDDPSQS